MKKFFSTLIVIAAISASTAFADSPPPPPCVDGHMHLPGYVCTPPDGGRTGNGNRSAADDSTLTYITTLIAEYNPFVYFLK